MRPTRLVSEANTFYTYRTETLHYLDVMFMRRISPGEKTDNGCHNKMSPVDPEPVRKP